MFTKEEIGCVIKASRIASGMTQAQVAKALGRPQNTISAWEVGRAQPDANTLFELFEILGRSVDEAFGFSPSSDSVAFSVAEKDHIKKYRLLDPLGKEAVDSVLDIEHRRYLENLKRRQEEHRTETSEEITGDTVYFTVPEYSSPMSAGTGQLAEEEWAEDLLLTKAPPRGTSYIARVQGNSMEPTYQDGDRLFIRSAVEIEPGQIGVFLMDGQHWVKELGDGVLVSHNSEYDPIPFTEGIQCQGLVLGVCDDGYFD